MTATGIFRNRSCAAISARISSNILLPSRPYSTELPRPPPATEKPVVETFSAPSRPSPVFTPPRRLPPHQKTWPIAIAVTILGVGCWAAFFGYVTNETKATSSVVKQILRTTAKDSNLRQVLGDDVVPQPEWWLNGRPQIRGELNQLQGNVDLSMRLQGSRGAGTLHFTSVRKARGIPYEILRFRVIADNGTVVEVDPRADDT
ncbi:cytochrome oxidase complex assembly protein 1-domain-containing protein [Mycena latifolia]|nr:cytochrome oxidase complex assembly protein 1-domain-containing protein [Mycena latifolia]